MSAAVDSIYSLLHRVQEGIVFKEHILMQSANPTGVRETFFSAVFI